MLDQTIDGRRLRFLTGIDEFAREAIWIECARYLNSHDVVRVLDPRVEARDYPAIIKSDNGADFASKRIEARRRVDRNSTDGHVLH